MRFVAWLVIVVACNRDAPKRDPAREAPAVAAQQAEASVPDPIAVPYDCTTFVPSSGSGCNVRPDIAAGALALEAAASRLLEYQAAHHPPAGRWRALQSAIDDAAKVPVEKLSVAQRIVLQNAALRIAVYTAMYASTEPQPTLVRSALAVVERLAVPAAKLRELGEAPRIEGWIGPAATWRHRDRRKVPAMHAAFNQHAKYFRPVLAGTRRAVFSQLVAIDSDGRPHITPIVGEIEMRAGAEPTSAACVAELELAELACNPPGLVFADLMTHATTHFFRREGANEVACNACHTSSTFPLVPEAEAAALIATEMTAALADAKQALDRARAAAR